MSKGIAGTFSPPNRHKIMEDPQDPLQCIQRTIALRPLNHCMQYSQITSSSSSRRIKLHTFWVAYNRTQTALQVSFGIYTRSESIEAIQCKSNLCNDAAADPSLSLSLPPPLRLTAVVRTTRFSIYRLNFPLHSMKPLSLPALQSASGNGFHLKPYVC